MDDLCRPVNTMHLCDMVQASNDPDVCFTPRSTDVVTANSQNKYRLLIFYACDHISLSPFYRQAPVFETGRVPGLRVNHKCINCLIENFTELVNDIQFLWNLEMQMMRRREQAGQHRQAEGKANLAFQLMSLENTIAVLGELAVTKTTYHESGYVFVFRNAEELPRVQWFRRLKPIQGRFD